MRENKENDLLKKKEKKKKYKQTKKKKERKQIQLTGRVWRGGGGVGVSRGGDR